MGSTTAAPPEDAGDEAAFAALVREHADVVYGMVLRRVRDAELAHDLAQETFLRAWRGFTGFRGETTVRGWLCAIAANVVRDHARRAARRPIEAREETFDRATHAGDPALRVEQADGLEQLVRALETLPENHREMFLLRERDGLSYKEIAAVIGCPVGSVMSGLARARERLLRAMEG